MLSRRSNPLNPTQETIGLTATQDMSLLATSNIVPSGQQCIFNSTKQFLRLQIESTYQQSIVMRLNGDIEGSERTIKLFTSDLARSGFLQREDLTTLYLSQAMNHMYSFQFDKAHEEIAGLPGNQEHLLWDYILCVGRIMRVA
ncbi:hypothetical protein FQN50_009119 [Emmonsiellopsis sp. PD_5]|nr:hypothetical protein FQN50_009119 [Emmonsiellopsis sp. PD_5]